MTLLRNQKRILQTDAHQKKRQEIAIVSDFLPLLIQQLFCL